jgi:hypothetical protein
MKVGEANKNERIDDNQRKDSNHVSLLEVVSSWSINKHDESQMV